LVELLDHLGLDDLPDPLLLLQHIGADKLLEHGPDAAVWLHESLEDIGVIEGLAGLGGHPHLGLLLEQCSHLSFSLNKYLVRT